MSILNNTVNKINQNLKTNDFVDLIDPDITGPWDIIKHSNNVSKIYKNLSFNDSYCWLNCQRFDPDAIPTESFNKFVFSFHTEFLIHDDLKHFFNTHPDKTFLIITDWHFADAIFPSNVETICWITLHLQASNIMSVHGYNDTNRKPSKKLSALSFRHELHKAAVTAYILSNVKQEDRHTSWWNVKYGIPYYLQDDYHLPEEISDYVKSDWFQNLGSIKGDGFSNSPMANCQWQHPAYLDCVFNFTNESVFNSNIEIGRLPGPYITDKTWKPLFSGCGVLPVGQYHTLAHLNKLGFTFDYGLNLSFDNEINDNQRLLSIFRVIDEILGKDLSTLTKDTVESGRHNVDHIVSGKFEKICNERNDSVRQKIDSWINLT